MLHRHPNVSTRNSLKTHWSSVCCWPFATIPIVPLSRLLMSYPFSSLGHYTALQHSAQTSLYENNPSLSITVTVDELLQSDHRVIKNSGSSTGKFTFTAAEGGDHRICFTPSGHNTGGWLSGGTDHGNIKLSLDLAIGETSAIESSDKGKLSEIAQKVRDLNARLQDVRREQVFQRVSLVASPWSCWART